MRNFSKALLAVAVGLAVLSAPLVPTTTATADQFIVLNPSEFGISDAVTAVDVSDAVFVVRYVGPTPTGATTVEVAAATGDLTFIRNAAADTTLECPVSGALGGIIDISNAECNTVGEIIDAINKSPDWVAVAVTGLRDDDMATANGGLVTRAATRASVLAGVPIFADGAELDFYSMVPRMRGGNADMRDYGLGSSGGAGGPEDPASSPSARPNQPKDLYEGITSRVTLIRTTATHGGAGTVTVRAVTRRYYPKSTAQATAAATASYSETVRTVWAQAATASTTEQVLDFEDAGGMLLFNEGETPHIRRADTAQTAQVGNVAGFAFKKE